MVSRILGIAAVLAVGLSASAGTDDPAGDLYNEAKQANDKLHSLPIAQRKMHHFQAAIDDFRKVEDNHPKSYVADDALYMIGQLYTELYDISRIRTHLDKGIAAYKSCTARFPKSNYADDCLLLQAKALARLGKHDAAVVALKSIMTDYASGDMAREAEQLLARQGIRVVPPGQPLVAVATTPIPAVLESPADRKKLSGGTAQAEVQAVTRVEVVSNDGYTRVGIFGGGPMAWTVNELPAVEGKDRRIYVDLKKAKIGEDLKKSTTLLDGMWNVKIEDGLLRGARVAQNDPETVRVVVDVVSIEEFKIIPLDNPFRILLQVSGKNPDGPDVVLVSPQVESPTPVPTGALLPAPGATPGLAIGLPTPSPTPDPVVVAKALGDSVAKTGVPLFEQLGGFKIQKIYVDAGHGGNDPGAHGSGGLQEKVVTLALAKKVQAELLALGYQAVLTRDSDTYVALDKRSGQANEGNGDLFVSIHCNSTETNKSVSAVETYYADSASDKAAAKLAERENETTEQKMSELEGILKGLARSVYTDLSARAATRVQKHLFEESEKANPETKDHGMKSALFVVLFTADMPAVLVETAFISNKKDEKRLKDDKHLAKLAKSIARGLDDFAKSVAPVQVIADEKETKVAPPEKADARDAESGPATPKGKSKSESGTVPKAAKQR